ncbi:hypothetical protein HW555_013710 [Spodoptera exigua]|uniref:Uncharacterized protein n=1 Tax=Spodoptera exigua TaxID=7107 RepID=A0A835G543_SPOEX|nr:hypothetical protein HW555_013710 [Spodoptera exigua]
MGVGQRNKARDLGEIPFVVDICEATCEEYTIIFAETTWPRYILKPLTRQNIINWVGSNDCEYCNSTEIYYQNKECLLEFECTGRFFSCIDHVKPINNQFHEVIPDDHPTPKVIKRNLNNSTVYENNNKTDEPSSTPNEEVEALMFNVHLIYNNLNDASNANNKELKNNDKIICKYAEIVCNDDGIKEETTSKRFENTDRYFYDNSTSFLNISIDRDETSPLQPIFTGYFPEVSKKALFSYENDFKYQKTASLKCPILKNDTSKCSMNKSIHVYIKSTYIQNNTKTYYPNCTMDTKIIHNAFNLICDNVSFGKYNKHLKLTSNPDLKQAPTPISDGTDKQDIRSLSCQIMEFKDFPTNKGLDNSSEIYFENCSKNHSWNLITDVSDKGKTTNITSKKYINIIVNDIANCTQNQTLNIQKGKFIDFEVNDNIQHILKNDEVEINLPNCMDNSTVNSTKNIPETKVDLTIFLKNEPLNASGLKLLNRASKDTNETEKLFLQCGRSKMFNNKTMKTRTVLQCDTIDLKDLLIPENNTAFNLNTTQDHRLWKCKIIEFIDSSPSKGKITETYFNDCFKGNNKEKNELIPFNPDLLKKDNTNSKNLIKIIIKENSNCTQNPALNIQRGKLVDFEGNNEIASVLENDIVEINISNCIKINQSLTSSTDKLPEAKVDITIFLKNESLNASDLMLLKQMIERALECENIDPNKIIILPTNTDVKQKNIKDTATDNANKSQKNYIDDSKTITKDIQNKNIGEKDKREIQNYNTFNRKKYLNKPGKQENLVQEEVEVEKIILITLTAIAGTSSLLILAMRFCKKPGHEYNPAATREPGVDEETAF